MSISRSPRTGPRPLPDWGQMNMVKTIGGYDYKALLVCLEKRLSNHYQYQVAYTLSKQDADSAPPSPTPTFELRK